MSQSQARGREVAHRLFATEYEDADFSYSESDEERAPNYVITPSGARVNRVFVVGVLTEVEPVSDDVLRARVVDPTGAFVLYAGQYQPDEQAFLESVETPTFVAVTGKARTFQPDDSDQVFTSIRPESINEVDAETRDHWTVQAAEQTLDRVGHAAVACALRSADVDLGAELRARGVSDSLAVGLPLALEHYGTTPTYLAALRGVAIDAARVVAGELDEVKATTVAPDADGSAIPRDLVDDVSLDPFTEPISGTSEEPSERADRETEPATVETDTITGDTEPPVEETAAPAGDTDASAGNTATPDSEDSATTEPVSEESSAVDSTPTTAPSDSTGVESDPEPAMGTATATEPGGAEETYSEPEGDETPETQPEDEKPEDTDPGALADDVGDFDGEFDLDDDERKEIESEYGTDFQTGAEVDSPGEADIETPVDTAPPADESGEPTQLIDEAGDDDEMTAETGAEIDQETDPAAVSEPETDVGSETTEKSPDNAAKGDHSEAGEADTATGDVTDDSDLQAAVLDLMEELDDGAGTDREVLISEVVDRRGTTREAVEDAIEDAMMDGKCYEPDGETLKSI